MRLLGVVVAALVLASPALAGGPTMRVGASEDSVKSASLVEAKTSLDLLRLAGLDSVRVSATWAPGLTQPDDEEALLLRNVVSAAGLSGLGAYVSVSQFGSRTTPLTDVDQTQFARFAAWVAKTFPTLRGVVVGNEPNLNRFWLPQFNPDGTDAAAAAFETLLAKSYDAIKAANPKMRVIGVSLSPRGNDNPSGARLTHSPTVFIRDLGAAYRASGRTLPIMDSFSFHPYGDNSSQPPTFQHPRTTTIALADYGKLVQLLGEAFDGTAQPGSTLPIFYDEYGVESTIPSDRVDAYSGSEPDTTKPVDEKTQGEYYRMAIAIAFCQPNVEGMLLFHAIDEQGLDRWQSGVYYVDGAPKAARDVVKQAASLVRRGVIAHCEGLELTPKLRFLRWPQPAQLRGHRASVSFECDIDCAFEIRLERGAKLVARSARVSAGGVRRTVTFRTTLAAGTYRVRLRLNAPVNPGPPVRRVSPRLVVPISES
jgi:hypothetical protein